MGREEEDALHISNGRGQHRAPNPCYLKASGVATELTEELRSPRVTGDQQRCSQWSLDGVEIGKSRAQMMGGEAKAQDDREVLALPGKGKMTQVKDQCPQHWQEWLYLSLL